MPLSLIIKKDCPKCGLLAVEEKSFFIGKSKFIKLKCGHLMPEHQLDNELDLSSIVSSDGKTLMPYQIEGIKFLSAANASAILADEQGLGKTIQALGLLKVHSSELIPAIIVCPTSVKIQWHREIVRWCGRKGFITQVIGSGKDKAIPGFDVYVTTYDMLKKDGIWEMVKDDIKFVVLDECQKIKNHLSDRAKAVMKLCKNIEHVLPMSGTPIENNAGEYFTSLNLVRPRMFPEYHRYITVDCDSYNDGYAMKVGGLRNPELFHEKTKSFILRRKKADVLKDLPEKFRKFEHVELVKGNKAYAKLMSELEELYYSDEEGMEKQANLLAILNKMRYIVGVSKVEPCAEFVQDFLESCDRKITIFVHHHDVHTLLEANLNNYLVEHGLNKVLNITSSLDANKRTEVTDKFQRDDKNRVLIAPTLAAGVGINLQFCSDAIIMEREWNPPKEEQAEDRFHRFGQINPVSITYMISSETVDEKFTEIVERKRAVLSSTLDNKELAWDQNSLMTELLSVLMVKGKKSWKL